MNGTEGTPVPQNKPDTNTGPGHHQVVEEWIFNIVQLPQLVPPAEPSFTATLQSKETCVDDPKTVPVLGL